MGDVAAESGGLARVRELSEEDFRGALEFVRRCEAAVDLVEFREAVLTIVDHVPGHIVSYSELNFATGVALSETRPERYRFEGDLEIFARHADQHPLVELAREGDFDPQAISDLLDEQSFHATDLYRHYFRPRETEDQLAMMMPSGPEVRIGVVISRRERGFSERDHTFLRVVAPYAGAAYLGSRARGVAAAAVAGERQEPADLVVVSEGDEVTAIAGEAARLLAFYLGEQVTAGSAVTPELGCWLAEHRRDPPLGPAGEPAASELIRRDGGILLGRVVSGNAPAMESVVILEERRRLVGSPRAEALGLTGREAEIAELLVAAESNEQIAGMLSLSHHTVKRHLEHIYRKLGVGSRAEAIACLLGNG